jgi:hypothetical protein
MALPLVPGAVQLKFTGSLFNIHAWNNFLHLHYNGTSAPAGDLNNAATVAGNAYATNFMPHLSISNSLTQCTAIDLANRDGTVGLHPVNQVGGDGDTVPSAASVAVVVSWVVQYRWRGGHPRIYLAGVPGAHVLNGSQLETTWRNGLITAARAFLNTINTIQINGVPVRPCVVRYSGIHETTTTFPIIIDIQDANVHARADSMRRRTGREAA